jgi:outer membrane protein insertion porin family
VRSPVLLFSLLAAVVIAPGQESHVELEGRTITRIEFDPSPQPLPLPELQGLLPFRPGAKLRREDVRTAIEKLYATGRFSDISIEGEQDGEGVAVRISTQLNYFVSSVNIEGAVEPPSRGQLATAAKLELGRRFSEADLKQAAANIEDRLRANGLYQARIKYSVAIEPDTEEARIQFNILSGRRARFDGVKLLGDFSKPEENVINEAHWHLGFGPFRLQRWRLETETLVQNGVNRILKDFQRGDHLTAVVNLDQIEYHESTNTVTPEISIESGPIVEVTVTGAKVSKGRLRQLIPIYQERTVDRGLLVEGRRNLLEYFQSQGYFDAQVEFKETTEEGREVVDFDVTPQQRHKLAKIDIEGNHYFDTPTLREHLDITPARFPVSRWGHYSQKMLDRSLDSLRDLYHANGFRDANVTANTSDQNGQLAVRLQVKEGPQWFVSKLVLDGAPESDLPYLHSVMQSTEGEPFSEANVAADRDSILSYYYNNGYSDAVFDWSEAPGPADYRVDITYTIRPGKREYVRSVLVRGLQTTRASLVARRISLKPGDPISLNKIAESQQKLYDLGIFSKVQTAVQNPEGDEDSKYVLFDLNEGNRYSFNGGIGAQLGRIGSGVTTFDEPAGTTGFVPRISLGLSRLNLFGEGRTLSLQTRFSTIEQRILLSYTAPQWLDNPNLTLTVSGLFDNSRDIRTFAARRWEGSVQLAQRFTRAVSMQYRFTYRRVTLSDIVVTPELIPLFSQPDRVGMLSMTFIQDRRDDPINSHRGYYNTIDAGIALSDLGSQTEFTRLLMRNSTYYPIGKDVVLARTLQFGWIQRLAGEPTIPLAERFFSGGANSDRAFPDNQAGPRDLETGFPLGGDALLIHSTELRFPLFGDNVGGVLFHDMGNVYDDVRDVSFRWRQRNIQDFDYMVQGFGFGIRYHTPIGPIRVDFSLSPNSPRFFGFEGTFDQLLAGQGQKVNQRINIFQFHFSLGQTF